MTTIETDVDTFHARGQAASRAEAANQHSGFRRARAFRPGPVHASFAISFVVAVKALAMSYAALHDLAIRNLVPPDLASNVPIAIDGLMVGSILASAFFRRRSARWWYATGLFVLSTWVSVAGNIEYARENGGDYVAIIIHAGMPLITMCAAQLTLLLWRNPQQDSSAMDSAVPAKPEEEKVEVDPFQQSVEQHLRRIGPPPPLAAADNLVHVGGRA